MIQGVSIKPLEVIPDERGRLMEILRNDDYVFNAFGQVYMTTAYPGVVKGWHYHKKQTDNMACIKGMMKLVLYDDRDNSSTKHDIDEIFFGEHNYTLVQIPPYVWHGFKCISETEAIVINIPDFPYNYAEPDEYRKDIKSEDIPYDWKRMNR